MELVSKADDLLILQTVLYSCVSFQRLKRMRLNSNEHKSKLDRSEISCSAINCLLACL